MALHTLVVILQDRPGVLHRTVTLLRRRGFNIASLAVGRSEAPGISRMTLVVDAADATQVVRQLDRLVEVLAVVDATHEPSVERETALAKVVVPPERLAPLAAFAVDHGARVLDVRPEGLIVEITDTPERVEQFIARLREHGLAELMRTGRLTMLRARLTAPAGDPAPHGAHPTTHYRAQADGLPHEEAA